MCPEPVLANSLTRHCSKLYATLISDSLWLESRAIVPWFTITSHPLATVRETHYFACENPSVNHQLLLFSHNTRIQYIRLLHNRRLCTEKMNKWLVRAGLGIRCGRQASSIEQTFTPCCAVCSMRVRQTTKSNRKCLSITSPRPIGRRTSLHRRQFYIQNSVLCGAVLFRYRTRDTISKCRLYAVYYTSYRN